MRKQTLSLVFALVACLVFSVPVFAMQSKPVEKIADRQLERLVDQADLLTDYEEEELLLQLNEISERQACDVIIITVKDLGGLTATQFADDAFDNYGYGMGKGFDGILFLISMGQRDWAISTHGFGITAFTDAGQAYIVDQVLPDVSDAYYNDAFTRFAELCDLFITQAKTGTPYDVNNMPKETLSLIWIPGSLLIGMVIAFIIVQIMKGQLKSVRRETSAANYVRNGSFNLALSKDNFLYNKVDRQVRPKETSAGGSSTHTSSSGRTHGGSSGKF